MFQQQYPNKTILSDPFFNERIPDNGWQIRITVAEWEQVWWYEYLQIDENGTIRAVGKDSLDITKNLLGQQIDLNDYNGEQIIGNYTDHNGVVEGGKFILS